VTNREPHRRPPGAVPEVSAQHYYGAQLYRALTALLNSPAITEEDAEARGYAGRYRQARAIVDRVERTAARGGRRHADVYSAPGHRALFFA
jgi:hypothetical protein